MRNEVHRWGVVFCEAAEALGNTSPRYTTKTKREALALKTEADRECASKAKHHVRLLESRKENLGQLLKSKGLEFR